MNSNNGSLRFFAALFIISSVVNAMAQHPVRIQSDSNREVPGKKFAIQPMTFVFSYQIVEN